MNKGPNDTSMIFFIERELILSAIEKHNGNRSATARFLGISLRTLRLKLAKYASMGCVIPPYVHYLATVYIRKLEE